MRSAAGVTFVAVGLSHTERQVEQPNPPSIFVSRRETIPFESI